MKNFPHYLQIDFKDCGPTCLKIIAKHYGRILKIQNLREYSETNREGSNLLFLSEAAEKIGFRTLGVKQNLKQLQEVPLPCVLHWNKHHYVVLYKIKHDNYFISDPAIGKLKYNKDEFIKFWIGNNANETSEEGIALLLEPAPKFYKSEFEKESTNKFGFSLLFKYLIPYKLFVIQLGIGLIVTSILQFITPFLTQSIVDIGVQNQNTKFIYLILIAQIVLFACKIAIEIIQSWIALHLSARIKISLISDFFIKLMNLPISFFDVKMNGDIMQRINDHHRIEKIITSSSLNILFSIINPLGEIKLIDF